MAKIRWSQETDRWLREIHRYIAKDNPSAAAKVIAGIYEKAQLLSDFPQLGHKYRRSRKEIFAFSTTATTELPT